MPRDRNVLFRRHDAGGDRDCDECPFQHGWAPFADRPGVAPCTLVPLTVTFVNSLRFVVSFPVELRLYKHIRKAVATYLTCEGAVPPEPPLKILGISGTFWAFSGMI